MINREVLGPQRWREYPVFWLEGFKFWIERTQANGDQRTRALARISATPNTAARRMDEMERQDPNPDDGAIEVGVLKEPS